MSAQSLSVGERDRRWRQAAQPRGSHSLHGRDADEIGGAEAAAGAGGAARRQDVVRAGDVVAKRLRAVMADEHRAGAAQPLRDGI